jgi:hypothetical protein
MVSDTRCARSGEINIAYRVAGEGPFDIVFVPGSGSHVEVAWEVPIFRTWFERFASFARLIHFDKRGTGMSDTLETRMDDVRAVMDAAGSERAAVIGVSEGGPMSVLFAATSYGRKDTSHPRQRRGQSGDPVRGPRCRCAQGHPRRVAAVRRRTLTAIPSPLPIC